MKKGYMYIASSGYDPEKGKHIKDPYLGDVPTLGACMPNIRKHVQVGDSIFVISGKLPNEDQYIIGGFEVAEKLPASEAFKKFPEHHLVKRVDHQLSGNIIINSRGEQHFLDNHKNFDNRLENYIVGKNSLFLRNPEEVIKGRKETLKILKNIFGKNGKSPQNIIGRMRKLDEKQVKIVTNWLKSLKTNEKNFSHTAGAGHSSSSSEQYKTQPILF